MPHIVVDPVTRIEGHLRVEIEVQGNQVTDAISSGTAWRGLEVIAKNRDPRDLWAYIQRICGVCTSSHSLGCVRAVEDALGIKIPKNANYIRNIMAATLTVHDHLVHFYHLHALDWVSPIEALKADATATANLQNTVLANYKLPFAGPMDYDFSAYPKEFPKATPAYFQAVKDKVQALVSGGQLGIFAANWWDHPDYQLLPPEVHLMAVAHYLNMLDKQREVVIPHVIFGGKNPHPHYVVGGMPCAISMDEMNAPVNSQRLAAVDTSIRLSMDLVNNFYLPDLLAIGHICAQKGVALDGGGLAGDRVLGFGSFPEEPFAGVANGNGEWFSQIMVRCNAVVENFKNGVMNAKVTDITSDDLKDPEVLTETTTHSWYKDGEALHPWDGKSEAEYTGDKSGNKSHWQQLDEQGKYSWIKTPMWRGKTAEVGPLARYIIIYTKVKQNLIQPNWAEKMMVDQVDAISRLLNVAPERWLLSTLGRTVTRGLDAQLNACMNKYFFDKLVKNIGAGDTDTADVTKWKPSTWPTEEVKGVGLYEAPRGALSHWVAIKDGKCSNYQAVVPTTWNACPRDEVAGRGAFERTMMETVVKIPEKPLEIVRAVRSFDPCIACATHLYDAKGRTITTVNTDPYIRGGLNG